MAIVNAPFLPLRGFWDDKTRLDAVYTFDGQTYYARQLGRHVFYHLEGEDSIEQTRFVCCDSPNGLPDWPSKEKKESPSRNESPLPVAEGQEVPGMSTDGGKPLATFNAGKGQAQRTIYPETVFARQVRAGESGRYALLNASSVYRECAAVMFFRQDGTGTCLYETQAFFQDRPEPPFRVDFAWDGRAHGILRPSDVLATPWENVRRLCEDVLREQVCPRMDDPFLPYAELPDEPFEYACGSEAELERLTRCILHIHPELYAASENSVRQGGIDRYRQVISITYKASTTQAAGGPEMSRKNALRRLLEIAFEYNTFQGGTWRRVYRCEGRRPECYAMDAYWRRFRCPAPSAHEQAEALLSLHDWLEGKVSEKQRRRLLRLDPPNPRKPKQA